MPTKTSTSLRTSIEAMSKISVPLILLSMISLSGHSQNPLASYIKDYKYEPFIIPRADWGVGTVIHIKKGKEEIIALNKDCLNDSATSTAAELQSYSYDLNRKNSFELSLAKIFHSSLDLTGAFQDKRIKKVTISVGNVVETIIPTIEIKKSLDDLAKNNNDACVESITNGKNLVIVRTISIDSLSYSFLDSNNRVIPIDINILNSIKSTDSLNREFSGKSELKFSKKMFIGYRVSKFTLKPGLVTTEIVETPLLPKDVEALKKGQ